MNNSRHVYHSGNSKVLMSSVPATGGKDQLKRYIVIRLLDFVFPVAENNTSLESRSGSGSIRSKLRRSGTRICQVFYSFMSSFPLPPKTRQTKPKPHVHTLWEAGAPLSGPLCWEMSNIVGQPHIHWCGWQAASLFPFSRKQTLSLSLLIQASSAHLFTNALWNALWQS